MYCFSFLSFSIRKRKELERTSFEMRINRLTVKHILACTILGLISTTILFVIISISTTHWAHSKYVRAGLWKLCHLQPVTCFYSILQTPIALTIVGFILILLALFSTIIFDIFNYHFTSWIRYFSFVSVSSLTLASFFFTTTTMAFAHQTGSFCYSYYLMIIAQLFTMLGAIGASYLQGQRNALVSTSVIMSRLAARRP